MFQLFNSKSIQSHLSKYKWLYSILFLGLVLRLAFIWWGAFIYYPNPFYFGDSISYTQAFLNLWNKGIYSFDLTNADAYFGRLPAYPLFYGLHYIIFGEKYVHIVVAHSQALTELLAIASLFFTLKKIATLRTAYIGAFLYAFYPFTIVWTTPIYTESIATSLTVIFFYLLYNLKKNTLYPIYLGIFIALCFYVREYLGILIISAGIGYIIFANDFKQFLKWTLLTGIVFGSLYSLWPIRNYVTTGRIILIKTESSGYGGFDKDLSRCRKWLYAWTDSANHVIQYMSYENQVVEEGKPIYLPSDVAPTLKDKERIYEIMNQSIRCGSSFRSWRNLAPLPANENCTEEVAVYYDSLFADYTSKYPVKYYFYTPSKNFYKSIFKSSLSEFEHSSSQSNKNLPNIKVLFIKLIFGYRSLLLIIGFITLFIVSVRNKKFLPLSFFIVFMYIFINFFIRQLEMRYLLQADTVLLLFSAIGLNYCIYFFKKNQKINKETL